MYFLVDDKTKIIFAWSPKCGCSHIKRIFKFLYNNNVDVDDYLLHTDDNHELPIDIENYTTIIISRNPYKRIISGFLDKYNITGYFRDRWKYETLTFSMFINELLKEEWTMIEPCHFTAQTDNLNTQTDNLITQTDNFDRLVIRSECIKIFDIENIDYTYIENLYNKKIPEIVLHKKEGHERKIHDITIDKCVCDLNIDEYYNCNVNIEYFYNEELQNKILKFYENDFHFFKTLGIDYSIASPL